MAPAYTAGWFAMINTVTPAMRPIPVTMLAP
jgi:hypothetical protein